MVLEQQEVPYRRHCPNYGLNDVLDDVVGVVSDFVFACAAMQHRALVLRSHPDVGLEERLNNDSGVGGSANQQHNILCVVDLEIRFAVTGPSRSNIRLLTLGVLVQLRLGDRDAVSLIVVHGRHASRMVGLLT